MVNGGEISEVGGGGLEGMGAPKNARGGKGAETDGWYRCRKV